MCWAEADDTRDYYPQGACECGAGLGAAHSHAPCG